MQFVQYFNQGSQSLDIVHISFMQSSSVEKQLEILTKSLLRNQRDLGMYQQEELQQCIRVDQMKSSGQDVHDINKQLEVLQETKQMIPLAQQRIQQCRLELENFIENNRHSIEPNSSQLTKAVELIKECGEQ